MGELGTAKLLPGKPTKSTAFFQPVFRQTGVLLALFLIALLVRLPALDTFVTVDEPVWINRARVFTSGLLFSDYECPPLTKDGRAIAARGWGCTFQTVHPGVTVMWGGGLGLLLHYWQVVRPEGVDLSSYLRNLPVDPLDPALLAPVRFPLALAGAVFIPVFYLLLKRLLSGSITFLAALLLALNPFHAALSRVLHQDGLTAAFMTLAALALMGYWLRGWRWYWLLISAVCVGLAGLSKPVGWFMLPYAGLLGGLCLYYRRQNEDWPGWPSGLARLGLEGILWGAGIAITFVIFLPAMWVIPAEVIRVVTGVSLNYVEQGHIDGHYFLGRVSRDPGPLFYPVVWLMRASPLEVLGILALLPAGWYTWGRLPGASIKTQVKNYPVEVALAFFVGLLLLFETLSSKKMDRYFLPALPAIEVFVSIGLLWLGHHLGLYFRRSGLHVSALLLITTLVVLFQGWLVWRNYPYYFTYYNPLLGGTPGAANLMTIGWGEGMNEAALYLNRQPEARSLRVMAEYDDTFRPFFAGETYFSRDVTDIIQADYVVYYINQWQRHLQQADVWRYLQKHALPAHRVRLQGLDFALVYRNPIQNRINWRENSLPNTFTLGYNLAVDGTLTLFWQNLGLAQPVWAGLAPAEGGEIRWLVCEIPPDFAGEAAIPGAVLESHCPLAVTGAPPGLYDLRLGVGEDEAITPIEFPAGRIALSIDAPGHYTQVSPAVALDLLAEKGLPAGAVPIELPVGQIAKLIGYQLEPDTWQPGGNGVIWLYWQPLHSIDLAQFAGTFDLGLQLVADDAKEPAATIRLPLVPSELGEKGLQPGAIVPVHYALPLPASLSSGSYRLHICPGAGSEVEIEDKQYTPALMENCLPLPLTVSTAAPGKE